jgi:predicted dienelactone hydrolase
MLSYVLALKIHGISFRRIHHSKRKEREIINNQKAPKKKIRTKLMLGMYVAIFSTMTLWGSIAQAQSEKVDQKSNNTTPIAYNLPKPKGPYNIGTTELHLVDPDRRDFWVKNKNREIMISIWYPAQKNYKGKRAPYMHPKAAAITDKNIAPSLGVKLGQIDWANFKTNAWLLAPIEKNMGNRPVILYSPGTGVPRTAATTQVEELVSHGYVVVTMDHTYETDAVEFPNDRVEVQHLPEPSVQRTRDALKVREQDIRFVLDQLHILKNGGNPDAEHRKLPNGLGQMLDLSKIGMFGHSAGGINTADVMYVDKRIDAGINLDGSVNEHIKESIMSPSNRGLKQPFMLMGAPDFDTHLTDLGWKSFWEHSTGWKRDLNISTGSHFTFTDHELILPYLDEKIDVPDKVLTNLIGTSANPERVASSIRTYITAFFDEHLLRKHQKLFDSSSKQHPDIQLVN